MTYVNENWLLYALYHKIAWAIYNAGKNKMALYTCSWTVTLSAEFFWAPLC